MTAATAPDRAPGTNGGRRIRVAFAIDNLQVGGTELNAVRTAERLDRDRFQLMLISAQEDGPLGQRYRDAGVPIHAFPIPNLYGLAAMRQGMRIARMLRSERVDILHAHDLYSSIFTVGWARVAGVRATIASRRWWEEIPRAGHKFASRAAYRIATRVLVNSPGIAQLVHSRDGVDRSRIVTVPNFVDDDAFVPLSETARHALRAELGIDGAAIILGCIANLLPVKEHEVLLRTFAAVRERHPRVHLVLVGEGSCRSDAEALARSLGISEAVSFAGRRPQTPNLHGLFDVSLLTSRSEGFPNTLVEAMAAGRPVVATRVGGVSDAVEDGVTGFLAPRGDVAGLASCLDRLLTDPGLRSTMGTAAARRARERFHARHILRQVESLYVELAGHGRER
jgi:glycosyltransferase involved in cell wall biosynthesis